METYQVVQEINNRTSYILMTQAWFIPGIPSPPRGPLARYRPIQPVQAVGAYVQCLTRPGDLVVDLFCHGPTVVGEAAAMGRRALGISVNPLLLVAARLGLSRCEPDALNAAFTSIADSPKGDIPLRHYVASLYRSACPVCDAQGIAVWFAWDRDGNYPLKKAVRCLPCDKVQEGVPDDEDVESARRIQPRGLAYYYALDRAAPPGHPARERATQLVELYTPRNLSVLMDLVRRFEELEVAEEVKLSLAGVLLDCFDLGSSLDPYGEERPRPRALRVPSRYIERNIWLCFEEGLSRLLAEEPANSLIFLLAPSHGGGDEREERTRKKGRRSSVPWTGDVSALVRGETEGYALVSQAARDACKTIPPGSAALIFADPPRPDAAFWALSALWAGWLWESPAAYALRPFLRRRRFDWGWHWRALQVALRAAGPLLTPQGHLIVLFSDPDSTLLESVCLAASGAGYILEGWGYSREIGHRLVWRWEGGSPPSAPEAEALERAIEAQAGESMTSTLRERGEPTPWSLLHASAYAGLAERGVLAQTATIPEGGPPALTLVADAVHRASEAAPMARLAGRGAAGEALWWGADLGRTAEPLADRVGALTWELLVQRQTWRLEELINTIYARFPGPLTPDLTLVLACIDSYSVQEGEMRRLRPEDDPQRRAEELQTVHGDLVELGRRLGFTVRKRGGWDVCWLEEGREIYDFAISATAALARHLLIRRAADEGAQRCLVIPGGRAGLVGLQLQRDPRLAQAVETDGWQFIKFRHLRRLIAEEELDHHVLKTVLGLDPIVEQEVAQIPLF